MKVKEESEKSDLKINIQITKIMTSISITSLQIEWANVESDKFHFLVLQNHSRWCLQP